MNTTTIEPTTHNGKSAFKLTCGCETHAPNANGAIVTEAMGSAIAAKTGKAKSNLIHGWVVAANHPATMIRKSNERKGVFAA